MGKKPQTKKPTPNLKNLNRHDLQMIFFFFFLLWNEITEFFHLEIYVLLTFSARWVEKISLYLSDAILNPLSFGC